MWHCAFLVLSFLLSVQMAGAQYRKERITALGEGLHLYDSQVEPGTGHIVSIGYEVTGGETYPVLLKTDRHGSRIGAKVLPPILGLPDAQLRIAANGDYLVLAPYSAPRFFRTDSSGSLIAARDYDFRTHVGQTVTGMAELPNGNIAICGTTDFEHQTSSLNASDGYLFFIGPTGVMLRAC